FDTANAAPGQGVDKVTFTARDLLVTTTRIADGNNDGIITTGSDGAIDFSGNGGSAMLNSGSASVRSVEFDGSVTNNGVTDYVYSTVGSSVGIADLHF
ncbi:MAG TPA: hypothetical protein VFQ57_04045, partial [Sphingomonas sp.]|nr:hypothetical protein [Sphingomonas sp.]